jgi:DNA-binding transcriptional LysR family regulator
MNLSAVDLNLLVALDALLTERHVSRAAARVGLTQPAMSNALARLRRVLGDPLFVRTPEGMRPTPRAEALAGPLGEALRTVRERVLRQDKFDPATAQRTFGIATQDYEQLVLLPAVTARLAREAPGIRLQVTTPSERLPVLDLSQGKIDIMIGVHQATPAGLMRQTLMTDEFLCVVADGPDAPTKLTLKSYAAMDHLLISPYGGMTGYVDEALAKAGLARQVKLAVPDFALAPWLLLKTPYVLTMPERAARQLAIHLPLRLLPPPVVVPAFTEYMFWHERTHTDPAHKWLRQVIKDAAEAV